MIAEVQELPIADGNQVRERAVLREGEVGHADGQLGVEHVRARRLQGLAHLGLGPDGAEQARARADHRAGLVAQHVVRERA